MCLGMHRTMYASPCPFEIISFCNPHPAFVGLNRTLVWPYPYLDRSWDNSTRITSCMKFQDPFEIASKTPACSTLLNPGAAFLPRRLPLRHSRLHPGKSWKAFGGSEGLFMRPFNGKAMERHRKTLPKPYDKRPESLNHPAWKCS